MHKIIISLALALCAASAWSATRTVTLSIPGMSCATCPITVKKALNRVPGVHQVSSNLEKRQSTVTFDDSKASIDDLLMTTAEAGYPSSVLPATKP